MRRAVSKWRIRLSLAGLIALGFSAAALAGSQAHLKSPFAAEQIAALAKKIERVAAAQGARVFLLARVGRPPDELPAGVEYTHVGIAVYSSIRTADGRDVPGYAIYNLYQDDAAPQRSHLAMDYPLDFAAGAQVLKAGLLIPKPGLQKRLLEVIASGSYRRLHNANYSVLSNPYTSQYQNCTEFVLDVINAAIYRSDDPAQLKVNAQAYFKAQTIRLGPLQRMFGPMFAPELRLGDQRGPLQTVTFAALITYLESHGLADKALTVTL